MKSRVSWRTKRYSDSGWKRKSVVLDMGAQLSGPSHRLVLGLTAPAACRLPLVVRLAAIVWRAILGTPPDVMHCAGADQVRVQVVRGPHRQRFLRGTRLGQADCHQQKRQEKELHFSTSKSKVWPHSRDVNSPISPSPADLLKNKGEAVW